jgi:hypothetical protein
MGLHGNCDFLSRFGQIMSGMLRGVEGRAISMKFGPLGGEEIIGRNEKMSKQ